MEPGKSNIKNLFILFILIYKESCCMGHHLGYHVNQTLRTYSFYYLSLKNWQLQYFNIDSFYFIDLAYHACAIPLLYGSPSWNMVHSWLFFKNIWNLNKNFHIMWILIWKLPDTKISNFYMKILYLKNLVVHKMATGGWVSDIFSMILDFYFTNCSLHTIWK